MGSSLFPSALLCFTAVCLSSDWGVISVKTMPLQGVVLTGFLSDDMGRCCRYELSRAETNSKLWPGGSPGNISPTEGPVRCSEEIYCSLSREPAQNPKMKQHYLSVTPCVPKEREKRDTPSICVSAEARDRLLLILVYHS